MKGFGERYQVLMFGVLAAAVGFGTLLLFLPFLQAILWATVLAVLMRPIHARFLNKRSENVAALLSVLTAIGLVAVPMTLVAIMVGVQINQFLDTIETTRPMGEPGFSLDFLITKVDQALRPLLVQLGADGYTVTEAFENNKQAISRAVSSFAAKGAAAAAQTIFMLVVALLTLFFLLRDGHRMKEPALALIPLPKEKSEAIMKRVEDTIFAVFQSVVLVGIVQGLIAGATYFITGVPNASLWTVATIAVCFIPLMGAPLLYLPIGLLHIFQGHVWQAAVVLVVGFGVVSQIDNLLKPWIIGARVSLHPMAVFFSLLGGIFMFGPIGLMAGPMLLSVALAMVDILREKIAEAPA